TSHSFINFGLGAITAWDSNAAAFSYRGYSQTFFILGPSVQVKQTRPTLNWYLSAYGGLTSGTSSYYYTTSNPSASAGFLYQISRHWQLNVNDNYMYTADPFRQYVVLS